MIIEGFDVGDRITSASIPSKSYAQYWMTVAELDGVVFGVEACESAFVLLSVALGVEKAADNIEVHMTKDFVLLANNLGEVM